jgi:uncharacterized protein GlcG (DUF336 family)
VVHYALGIPYVGQHGDDEKRWRDAFGEWPAGEPGGQGPSGQGPAGRGMTAAPTAQAQPEHRWAVALADQVMAEAQRRGQRVAVAIADHRGDPIQQDWMPGAPTAAVTVAQAVAAAAGTFHCRSAELAAFYPDGLAGQLGALLPFPVLAAPGGLPVEEDGRVVAGLGVAGRDPGTCEEIAVAVLAARHAG